MIRLLSLAVFLVAACGGSEKKSSPPSEPKGESRSLRDQMHEGFVHLTAAKSAVIEGRLADAKDQTKIVWPSQRPPQIPKQWDPYIRSLEGGIDLMAGASDLDTAAAAISAIGRSCGDCHQALGFAALEKGDASGARDPDPHSVGDYMRMHQWAADRMWEGLVAPSDDAWLSGAMTLRDTKLESIPEALLVQPGMPEMLQQVQQLAAEAANPGLLGPARQRLYADFLGKCAGCHESFLSAVD